jgi:hypothetical protein
MRTNSLRSVAILLVLAAGTTACVYEHTSELLTPTMPSAEGATGGPGLTGPWTGLWTSALPSDPSTWTCGGFQWNITDQTESSISGSFAALCAGVVMVQGSGSGQLNGSVATLSVGGQASVEGVTLVCPFTLDGVGHLQGEDEIDVTYTGSTCLGPVHGTETLGRP